MNICVIIVTYNRINLLKECVQCVKDQTYPVSRVIVIDNHSDDGTFEYLEGLKEQDNRFIIRHTVENLGGAGGFALGIRLAKRLDSDWDLIIDDDAMLRSDYVEKLISYADEHKEELPVALSGTVVTDAGITLNHRRRIGNKLLFLESNVPEKEYEKDSFSYELATFCGIMVRHDILVEEQGPLKDFFIWYDDTEYCMRLRKHGEMANICDAVLDHKTSPESTDSNIFMKTCWKHYYGYRNRFVTVRRHMGFATWVCVLMQFVFFLTVSGVMCFTSRKRTF